ncbi:hypothetical protein Tco_0534989 [Tanacetum coccineum]
MLYDNSSPRPPEEFNSENPTESFSPSPVPVEDSDSLMEEIDIFLDGDGSIPPGIESDYFDSEDDDNSTSRPEFESFHVDYPDSGDSTIDVVEDIPVDVPNILPTHPALQLDFDFIPSSASWVDCPDCDDSRARGFVLRSLGLHILSFFWEIRYPNVIDQRFSLSILNKWLRICVETLRKTLRTMFHSSMGGSIDLIMHAVVVFTYVYTGNLRVYEAPKVVISPVTKSLWGIKAWYRIFTKG